MLRPVETPQVRLLSGQSLQWGPSAGPVGPGPLSLCFLTSTHVKTLPLTPPCSNGGFGSLSTESEFVPHARSIAPSWRSPFLLKRRRVGGCANRNGEHILCSKKFCTPKSEKWHSLVKREQPCFYWLSLQLSEGRLGSGFSGGRDGREGRKEGEGGRDRQGRG